ncbi:MAG: DUF1553 domain-containing protein [Lewinella sp.]
MAAYETLPATVDFNQHIRPILSDRCWSCHGPDQNARQAALRLDTKAGAFAALSSGNGFALKSGSAAKSEAIARMLHTDPELQMPPPESQLKVSPREIALLTKWIDQGAKWKDHWAFLPIEGQNLPVNPDGYTAANDIDHFINERLRQENLPANGRADDERLLRRLYLDLTGLPPTPGEMDAWLANPSEAVYIDLVDQLLTTDAHAERLAMDWLDLARYADSHGMHADGSRLSWPYRDWVIKAFKANQPYNEFVRDQVAGDLLPQATKEQRIASAFNRMHPMTAEGGVIGEEMRLTYVFDRVNTVATGLLGLTMDCSRCHDHKFDPLTQEEYYGFSAFFNNFKELGMIGDDGNFGPYMMLADEATDRQLARYQSALSRLREDRAKVAVSANDLQQFLAVRKVSPPRPDVHLPVERMAKGHRIDDLAWATDNLELTEDATRGTVAAFNEGFDDLYFDVGPGAFGTHEPFTASLWFQTHQRDSLKTQTLMGTAGEKNSAWKGMDFYLDQENHLNVRLIRTLPDDMIHLRSKDSVKVGEWHQAGFSYDGTGRAEGLRIYLDGLTVDHTVSNDNLRGSIFPTNNFHWLKGNSRKLRLGSSYRSFTGENGLYIGLIDDIQLFNRSLTALEISRLFDTNGTIATAQAEEHLLRKSSDYQLAIGQYRDTLARWVNTADTLPRLMVSEEMPTTRPTYVLNRGAYDAKGKQVEPQTPRGVLAFSENLPKNREGLAQWMFLPENPLTARVAVNRYWQLLFGQGLVKTAHDFGSQGSLPSHPDLLDHLATTFRESGWDIRSLLRSMVLSEAYRRSSTASKEQRSSDPENLLLARGPSSRLPAELIRDNALAASGLLTPAIGGPSVRPYQPGGLWIQANNFSKDLLHYVPDHGDKLYRRSMYTFIKRTSPPPFLTNFDASGRDICIVKRSTTNTPLQALNLLNDPQFVETARVLAQRIQLEKKDIDAQLAHAFRLVAGRKAKQEEVAILRNLYDEELNRYRADPALADSLLTIGEYPVPDTLDPLKTAALASVGNILFSFDEAYVKR